MAASPATPQPSTKVCAGGYLPQYDQVPTFGRCKRQRLVDGAKRLLYINQLSVPK